MDFSYILEVDGYEIENFGNMKIMESVDGFGLSGVCTSEFTVEISAVDYAKQLISANAAITLSVVSGNIFQIAPTFYIASRSRNGEIVKFKCFDRMIFVDQPAVIPEAFFTDGHISGETLMSIIAEQCGFTAACFSGTSGIKVCDLHLAKEKIYGKTCRVLLEELSKAWCGIFKCSDDNSLLFVPFGGVTYINQESSIHAQIRNKSIKGPIQQVIVNGNGECYTAGNTSADVFGTIKIETEFASQAIADNLMERLEGYIYEAWSCDKCIIDSVYAGLEIPSEITFADGSIKVANYMVKIPTGEGIYIECGCNEVIENEFDYSGALSRQIKTKIGDGEKLGNQTMITRYQGIIHLGEKTTDDDGNELQNRYGYSSATANGIVEFDGAITSKVVPQSAKINADKTEATISYQDKTYKYNISYASDGSIARLSKSEVLEE